MDLVGVLTRYPVQVALSLAAVAAVGRTLFLAATGAPSGAQLQAAALAVVLIGFAAAFWARPVAAWRRS